MKKKYRFRRILSIVLGALAAAGVFINILVVLIPRRHIYRDPAELPAGYTVLVLGAQVHGTDTLSYVLEDRVAAGIEVVRLGKARKLLLSGDHGRKDYDEVNAMRKYVLRKAPWILRENIFMDHAGFNTYDSMYRARDVFKAGGAGRVIIVTQEFHIARAVFIARGLGLEAAGLAVDQGKYAGNLQRAWGIREFLARIKAFGDVLRRRKPRFLGEPISITGDGWETWD